MQKEEYLIKNACYSVTKYYLCKQNNKRSLLGRKQRSQVARSFPNRYLFSFTNKVTSLFSISCILRIILLCNCGPFSFQLWLFRKPEGPKWQIGEAFAGFQVPFSNLVGEFSWKCFCKGCSSSRSTPYRLLRNGRGINGFPNTGKGRTRSSLLMRPMLVITVFCYLDYCFMSNPKRTPS